MRGPPLLLPVKRTVTPPAQGRDSCRTYAQPQFSLGLYPDGGSSVGREGEARQGPGSQRAGDRRPRTYHREAGRHREADCAQVRLQARARASLSLQTPPARHKFKDNIIKNGERKKKRTVKVFLKLFLNNS